MKKDADNLELPYRYVQLDSWWYFKGIGGGVKNWTARPDVFPNGIQSMQSKTKWSIVAHNRYWYVDVVVLVVAVVVDIDSIGHQTQIMLKR